MDKGKFIGYYGNGAPRYENDETNYAKRGWSPTYNSSNKYDFARANNNTYKSNNGAYPDRLYY